MVARLGNVLYWLGVGGAVIGLVGAVLVALGTFGELPSALGYLKPTENLVVEMSFPRSDDDGELSTFEASIETPDDAPWGRWAFEKVLLKVALNVCESTQGSARCFGVGDRIAWEEHPLGELPRDPRDIAAAYGHKIIGTIEERIWTDGYTRNLVVTGAVLAFALLSYAVGWVARYILRGPS